MLEQSLRKLFEQQAEAEAPPGRITVANVLCQGRCRRRWHRIGAVGAPALAAAAAAAIALTSPALPTVGSGAASQSGRAQAPRHFSPYSAYAGFGSLPARLTLASGFFSADFDALGAGEWSLTVGAAGQCHLASREFTCASSAGTAPSRTSPAPAVNGHRAYWADPQPGVGQHGAGLIWQYKSGGWAVVSGGPNKQTLRHIATTVTFGGHHPSIRFAVKLSGLPAGWQIEEADFQRSRGVLWAYGFSLTNGRETLTVNMALGPDGPNACRPEPGPSGWSCRVIHGYHVTDGRTQPPDAYRPARQLLGADNAAGLSMQIGSTGRKPPLSTVALFRDMTILGTSPADWTTKPIS